MCEWKLELYQTRSTKYDLKITLCRCAYVTRQ